MSDIIIVCVITAGGIGTLSAAILYVISKKFTVVEDPRIDLVTEALPGANCGGCGFAGCKNFAEACVKEGIGTKVCTAGGNSVMAKVAEVLGESVTAIDPKVAVVRCGGSFDCRPRTNNFDGAESCAVSAMTYGGNTGCAFGCLGFGDCEKACKFDAIKINSLTGLPVVNSEHCTACGQCVTACPKHIIELRKKNKGDKKVFVSCVNRDKGAVAKKACSVACIGCGKCQKVCQFDAITIADNLAYIDFEKCKMCRKCVEQCPTGAILEFGFPPKKTAIQATENNNNALIPSDNAKVEAISNQVDNA